jgi:hypothetical protein
LIAVRLEGVLRLLALLPLLTFVLGITVLAAFLAVGGPIAVAGPHVVSYAWPLIYPLVALFGGLVGVFTGFLGRGRLTVMATAMLVIGAWLGEYLVLASGVLADELIPRNAVEYWSLATAGPLQPIAVLAGAWLGRRVAWIQPSA